MMDEIRDAPSLAELMAVCARDAAALAADKFGVELDGSFESIQKLESILAIQYASIPRGFKRWFQKGPGADTIQRFTFLWGGYLGEILRQRRGGTWVMPQDGPLAGFACLDVAGTLISPQAKVGKRLANGPEDDVWVYALVTDRELELASGGASGQPG